MSELISASDKLLQIKEWKEQEELQRQQEELQRLQRLIDDPIVERIKRALIKSIADTKHFPVKLVLKDELYVTEHAVNKMIETDLGPWFDVKNYQVVTRNGRGEATNHKVLLVQPK